MSNTEQNAAISTLNALISDVQQEINKLTADGYQHTVEGRRWIRSLDAKEANLRDRRRQLMKLDRLRSHARPQLRLVVSN